MNNKVKISFTAVCIIVLCISAFMMAIDDYWNGDEVITYSMANSNYDGWMFSSGRVGEYIKNEIIADNLIDTGKNFVGFALDLVKNFKNAAYFSYPRPDETGWYSGEEASTWFKVTSDERFDYASVYANAMGDDANSFLYYSLVHTVGSIFIPISNTSWAAFTVNAIAVILVMVLVFKIALRMGCSESIALLTMLCYGISGSCIIQVTTLRAYVVASVFQLALFLLHLRLYSAAERNDKRTFKNTCILLIIVYVIGYVTHYTILFWAAFLGLNTVIKFARTNEIRAERFTQKYIFAGIAAIILGVVIDPVSVMGLAMKFLGAQSNTEKSMSAALYGSIIQYVAVNTVGLVIIGVTFAAALIVMLRKKEKSDSDRLILYLGSVILEEGLILLVVSKQAYFISLYPLIFLVMVYLYAEAIKQINRGFKHVLHIALLVVLILGGVVVYSEFIPENKKRVLICEH